MSSILTPEKILDRVVKNKLGKAEAIELLISLIEESESVNIRTKSIEILSKLNPKRQKIFRFIENCFVSDEDSLVRNAAAKVLFHNFPKKDNYFPLKWSIQHENSAIIIRTLLDLFNSVDDPHYNIFEKDLIKRLKIIYGVITEEINLILNLEVLYAEYAKETNFKVGTSWFKIVKMLNGFPDSIGLITRLSYLKLGGDKLKPLPKSTSSIFNLRKVYLK